MKERRISYYCRVKTCFYSGILFYYFILLIIVIPNILFAESPDCSNEFCHVNQTPMKTLHIPFEENNCLACHSQELSLHAQFPDSAITFPPLPNESVCLRCHKPNTDTIPSHLPVAENRCLKCHKAHQSKNANLLIHDKLSDVCISCHVMNLDDRKWLHGPTAVGACAVCHVDQTYDSRHPRESPGSSVS